MVLCAAEYTCVVSVVTSYSHFVEMTVCSKNLVILL